AAVAEWYRYRTVACFVTGSDPVPLKTRRVGQRCTLNLSRAETSSRWCGGRRRTVRTEEAIATVERSIEEDLNESIRHRAQEKKVGSVSIHFMEDFAEESWFACRKSNSCKLNPNDHQAQA
ncbi:uncharacterized protein TNCV_4251581, partial [Trichonephila clavipes]